MKLLNTAKKITTAAAALAFCLHWRCDLLRRVRPGAYRGRRGLLPVPVPGCWRWH